MVNDKPIKRSLILAKKLESEGRYEEAAIKYEGQAMYDKAKECRRMAKIVEAEKLERAGGCEEAAEKFEELGVPDKADKYRRMKRIADIDKLERAGRYEDAAKKYEELEMWDKAGDCRRMAKTNYVVSANLNIGKVGTISMDCPHCGASQPIASKSNEVTCKFCGKNYVIPKKVLDLL